jgi:cytochrome P450
MALLNESSRSWGPHQAHDILLRMSTRDVDDEWGFFVTAICTVLVASMVSMFYWVLWKPYSKRKFYEKQGIRGPVFRPFIGNLPEIHDLRRAVQQLGGQISESPARRVGTELFVFSEKYGKVSVFEQGSMTRMILADAKLAKDVLLSKAGYYKRSVLTTEVVSAIAGHGSILTAEGGNWKQKNQIMSPAFRHTFLKGLFHQIVERGDDLVTKWQKAINNAADTKQGAEVAADLDVPETLLDIIIRTTFGSTSGIEGGDIYAVHEAVSFMSRVVGNRLSGYARLIPGSRFFPTATNINFYMKKRAMVNVLKNIVSARMKLANDMKASSIAKAGSRQSAYGSDVLGMMLEAMNEGNSNMTASQVLDECTVFFLATDSPTSQLLMWSLMLLAQNPDWQQRARSEVQEVLGAEATPQVDKLANLKLIDMILNETLRLYPPVSAITRDASKVHQLGSVTIAPGTNVIIPMSVLHQSKEIWGDDAHLFKPDRWEVKNLHTNGKNSADGLNDATAATAAAADSVNSFNNFMPFGGGNRICLGRNLARMTVKLLLAMLLRRFSFSVSPSYCHAPGRGGNNLWPKFGMQLLIKNVESEVTTTD